jgi:hypothetical protein
VGGCWSRVGNTGLRSPKPGKPTPPLGIPRLVPSLATSVLTLLGCIGGADGLCIPPVKPPDPLCSSFDDKLWIFVEARRGRFGRKPESSNWLICWLGGLVRGEFDARCAGFLATGGGAFDLVELCEAADLDRGGGSGGVGVACMTRCFVGMAFGGASAMLAPVWRLGGGRGGAVSLLWLCPLACSSLKLIRPILVDKDAASCGGGSFLGAGLEAEPDRNTEWLICSYGELEMLENELSLDPPLGTATQSGSSVGVKGFEGRLGLSIAVELPLLVFGGAIPDCAILPFSSHHLWRSELAGGRPGSIASYPIKSSSSESSRSMLDPSCPMSALRRSYSSRLILFR